MANINALLDNLADGQSKNIKGTSVRRVDYDYIIDNESYTKDQASMIIQENQREKGKSQYDQVAFLLVERPNTVIATRRIRNKTEHTNLLAEAKRKKLIIWRADVKEVDGKFSAVLPWIVDWESVDNLYENKPVPSKPIPTKSTATRTLATTPMRPMSTLEPIEPRELNIEPKGISCPFCGKSCTSTPGRTLHVKGKHPERFEEYENMKGSL
jgi:hypothetical protein